MKTYDIQGPNGRLLAFEIGNTFTSRRRVCAIAANIPGAKVTRAPKVFSWLRESSFCEFIVDEQLFEIEEPFGDSGRYWIGPVPPRFLDVTEKVRDVFRSAK
ncbi:hypothetical protein FNZ56_10160 [Pseudoluteimonas lycopersici]|uniref:Uncharacterized protein n=1 Tax=Pseudoluteimonas lycopersici TaxID=1324796 RepID=A0A516V6T1_9GAMM|nr:hypothetical protein FNZ56_10160 [Lysobacter lycopersici]